jgi:NitT/TauT family transport system substrate-binding protein
MWFDLAPFSIVTIEGSGINSLKDLEGRTIGTPSADSSWAQFPAVAELNGLDLKKIKQIEVSPAVRDAGLLAGSYDASTNYIASFPIIYRMAEKQGKKLKVFPFIQHGLDTYAQGFVVNETRLKDNPESVRRFLRAALRGGAYAMENPEEGMDALLKHVPAAGRQESREAWDLMVDLWLTPNAEKNGLGHMTEEKWNRTRDILTKTFKLPVVMPVKDLYTNDYLEKIVPKQRGPRVFPKVL